MLVLDNDFVHLAVYSDLFADRARILFPQFPGENLPGGDLFGRLIVDDKSVRLTHWFVFIFHEGIFWFLFLHSGRFNVGRFLFSLSYCDIFVVFCSK